MDKVGLYLQDSFSLQEAIRYVKYAEARGFAIVWQAEVGLARDSVVSVAAYAASTTRIQLGTGVMNIWTRHPVTIASELATLDDLAPERIVCGLGAWHEPLARQTGVNRERYLLAMREVVTTVRQLLKLERVTYQGRIVQLEGVQLNSQRKMPYRIPLYIGATGAKLLALSGEIADGVLLNYMVSPEYNTMALQQLDKGATKARRPLQDIERPQLILCSVDEDEATAVNRARGIVAQYLVQQPRMMRANGIPQGIIDDVQQVLTTPFTPQQLGEAARIVPDDVVQRVAACGTPSQVRERVRDYVNAGATYPVIYPLGDVRTTIDAFANGYSQ